MDGEEGIPRVVPTAEHVLELECLKLGGDLPGFGIEIVGEVGTALGQGELV